MIEVFICEDEDNQRAEIVKYVESYIMIEEFDMQLALATGDPEELLSYVQLSGEGMGLYFLDVDLKHAHLDGLSLAQQIREYDPRGFIVFITTHAELSYLTFTYKVEAMDYIIKDDFDKVRNRIFDCLKSVEERVSRERKDVGKFFTFRSGEKVVHELYDDILFLETTGNARRVTLHGKERQLEFYGSLKDLDEQFDEDYFFRTHKSFIVNLDRIKVVDFKTRTITMVNGAECLVSMRKVKELKERISQRKESEV
ncbi:response regulator transcription factor [Listeria booriae]|uniref:LytR/AlgR family response regulator transcription factor n=1 Tax=Listeria booriae TaxID=1552123 RepID=UPI0016244738|nr:LytTR family DNA-binding domain-containing protein [Listeria booriae]MBC1892018.1 response regulator transcription factor [Listeria booriae]MBC1898544.1 response regulator transcription factor [Listeria booriae]MBC1913444.1 response regulator transcription factor [Listeria booriae]